MCIYELQCEMIAKTLWYCYQKAREEGKLP